MDEPFRILSIDGGGVKGVIPAMVLSEIERRTGKRISELFDLIAGTSTGGILALALTVPVDSGKPRYSASDLIALYDKEGRTIFSHTVWQRIRSLGSLTDEKYPSGPIESVLDTYFGETRLSDALTNVFVTSYEIEQRRPFFFKSHNARENREDDFPMKLAARATSAAPTYFAPEKIETDGPLDYLALIDGGVFANNPAMTAYTEALCRFSPAGILMVSLGTGESSRSIPYDRAKNWGLAGWAKPILNVVFDGVSDSVDYELRSMCRIQAGLLRQYWRLQPKLCEKHDEMDDASPSNMHMLKLAAEEYIQTHDTEIEEVCCALTGSTVRLNPAVH